MINLLYLFYFFLSLSLSLFFHSDKLTLDEELFQLVWGHFLNHWNELQFTSQFTFYLSLSLFLSFKLSNLLEYTRVNSYLYLTKISRQFLLVLNKIHYRCSRDSSHFFLSLKTTPLEISLLNLVSFCSFFFIILSYCTQ